MESQVAVTVHFLKHLTFFIVIVNNVIAIWIVFLYKFSIVRVLVVNFSFLYAAVIGRLIFLFYRKCFWIIYTID